MKLHKFTWQDDYNQTLIVIHVTTSNQCRVVKWSCGKPYRYVKGGSIPEGSQIPRKVYQRLCRDTTLDHEVLTKEQYEEYMFMHNL